MTEQRADLLIELGCEELPPKALAQLAEAFFEGACAGLDGAHIAFARDASRYFYTPRRMAVLLSAVAARQPDRELERRGPSVSVAFDADGQPTKAAQGFARSVGLAVSELETLSTDGGEWLYCRQHQPGEALEAVLFPLLQSVVDGLPVPRPMRWADHEFSFVRPVHWLVVLYGDRVLDGQLLGCPAGRLTWGHRIHAPGPHELESPSHYQEALRTAHVEVDQDLRRELIRDGVSAAGTRSGGRARITDSLLEEVNSLVEWPVAIACQFDEDFLSVPQEALVASMEDHQKFFPVLDDDGGSLTARFIAVANLESADEDAVRTGFERVVRPRLADARFFWDQDLKHPLSAALPALDDIVFQQKLGSVGDKSKRISVLSEKIAGKLGAEVGAVGRAGLLCKCDLVSLMVGEFPELQGIMGGHYARASGEPEAVSTAIGEHYHPRFSGDAIPGSESGCIVAIADRLDTLVGIFSAGLKPSGNKDPFALRRAALGVIRILLESGWALTLDALLELAADGFGDRVPRSAPARAEAHEFMVDRLRQFLRDQGHSARQVQAALAAPLSGIPDLEARLRSVASFMHRPEAESLVGANKRIGNILKQAGLAKFTSVDENLLKLEAEQCLFEAVQTAAETVQPLFGSGDYEAALARLSALKTPVDTFFDQVMVMDESPRVRDNRLALLAALKQLFDRIADFSLVD